MSGSARPGPIYDRIKRELRAAIARGDYEAGVPFVTQRELCARYGVSNTTAVRALNDLVGEGVLVRHRGKGTFVAEHHATARPDVGDRSIACVVHGLDGPHVSSVVRGVESVCTELGYRMFLSDSDGSADREERALRQAVETNAAGVVLYPVDGQANGHLLDELRSRHIPVVLVDRYRTDRVTDAVITDNFTVGYELTKALIDRGHRRIATLWSETRCTSVHDRLTGHRQALREHDLPLVPEFTVLTAFWPQPDDVRQAALARLLGSAEPPTAILCSNGFVLAAVAGDLHQLGIDLSEQVELAGMDDAGPYDILPLTVVAATLPSREMGCRAMQVVAERIGTADPYADGRHIVLPAEIRTREAASGLLLAGVVDTLPDGSTGAAASSTSIP